MTTILLACSAALISFAATLLVRRYALARAIVDRPNDRSLHDHPVPRGGGIAVVATFLAGLVLLTAGDLVPYRLTLALSVGGLAVALVGWLDDRAGVPAVVRASVHLAAAICALFWLGGLEQIRLGAVELRLGVLGSLLACIGIVWWINLYNFMDGIDGLAGAQAVSVGVFASLLAATLSGGSLDALPLLLAGAAAGFLGLNWSPARVFMGDVGSGFLGFVFAVLAIASEKSGSLPLLIWVVLSGVFLFDATVTLLRRVLRGERWYAAHRTHAYQRLVTSGYSHAAVTSTLLSVNVLLALLAWFGVQRGVPLLSAAFALVVLGIGYALVEQRLPMPPKKPHRRITEPGEISTRP